MTATITIKINSPFTPAISRKTGLPIISKTGHMWYALDDGSNNLISQGFGPIEEHVPVGPGRVYDDDNSMYKAVDYQRTFTITDQQYQALLEFGKNPESYGFDDNYNGLDNSCVDFAWKALDIIGLNPDHFQGDLIPADNADDLQRLNPPGGDVNQPSGNDWYPNWLAPGASSHQLGGTVFGPPLPPWSPLILDLNADGAHSTALGNPENRSPTYFDMDNDGFAERTAWVSGGDGLLAIDTNANGKIDSQAELFGNGAGYADGFAKLAALDSNADGKITIADAQFANLKVWIDADADGITDAGELTALAGLGITQINLNPTLLTGVSDNGNPVSATSTFIMNGQSREIADHWFKIDQTDTQYLGGVTLDPDVLFLPTLKGFGVPTGAAFSFPANDNRMAELKRRVA